MPWRMAECAPAFSLRLLMENFTETIGYNHKQTYNHKHITAGYNRKHTIANVRSQTYDRKRTIANVQSQTYNHKRTITNVQSQTYNHKRTITNIRSTKQTYNYLQT